MPWPMRGRVLTVQWTKFTISRETFDEEDDCFNLCVYVIADPWGRPLYIGRATGTRYTGFGERYVGNSGSIPAMAHGTRNRLYLGKIRGRQVRNWYRSLEKELIARESVASHRTHPRYNRQFMKAEPTEARLQHIGEAPRFYHVAQ